MKVGRNDPCPCGSGKKYKKCCLSKDEILKFEYLPSYFPNEEEDDEEYDDEEENREMVETMWKLYTEFRKSSMKNKPHIKEYMAIRKIHQEILNSMVKYYEIGMFEQKIDPNYGHGSSADNGGKDHIFSLHSLSFDFASYRETQAFFDMMVYKPAPNMNCITEEYITKRKYRKTEKVEFLKSMLNSKLGLFDIVDKDVNEGYAYIKDVLSGTEYKLTDVGLSDEHGNEGMYIYTRIITYKGVNFGTGLNLVFYKDDPFIKSFIKRNKADYDEKAEYIRFVELYKYFRESPLKNIINAN
ncbi:MAG: SEC-C domain-containing protein [Clostridiales bacterium]|jgi:hypothetical protein|nr:SEC-C domain-containing protein [Clostridiales bacterium]